MQRSLVHLTVDLGKEVLQLIIKKFQHYSFSMSFLVILQGPQYFKFISL